MKCIATAAPSMMSGAQDWIEIIHYRILNNPQIRTVYGKVLSQFDISITSSIKELLLEIKNEDPDMFSESVNEVIELI